MEFSKLAVLILGIIALFVILVGFSFYYGELSEGFNNFLEPFGLGKKTETQNLPARIETGFTNIINIYKKCSESIKTGCICQKESLPHLSTNDYSVEILGREGSAVSSLVLYYKENKLIKQEKINSIINCYIDKEKIQKSNQIILTFDYPGAIKARISSNEVYLRQDLPSLYKKDDYICLIPLMPGGISYNPASEIAKLEPFKNMPIC